MRAVLFRNPRILAQLRNGGNRGGGLGEGLAKWLAGCGTLRARLLRSTRRCVPAATRSSFFRRRQFGTWPAPTGRKVHAAIGCSACPHPHTVDKGRIDRDNQVTACAYALAGDHRATTEHGFIYHDAERVVFRWKHHHIGG